MGLHLQRERQGTVLPHSRRCLPLLNPGAAIVLNGSINAHIGMPNTAAYAASKAALVSLARTLSAEMLPTKRPRQRHQPRADQDAAPRAAGHPGRPGSRRRAGHSGADPAEALRHAGRSRQLPSSISAQPDSGFIVGSELIIDGGMIRALAESQRASVASIRPYGSSVATNTSLRFSRPNGGEIHGQMMPIRHHQANRADLVVGVEHGLAHRVERVLHRLAVVFGKDLEQGLANGFVDRPERQVGSGVVPARGQRRREEAIRGLAQRRELVARVPGKRRARRLEDRRDRSRPPPPWPSPASIAPSRSGASGPRRMKA